MGTKRFDDIGDWCRHGVVLPVRCRRCQHLGEVDTCGLILRWGMGRHPEALPWRCSKCGSRKALVGRRAVIPDDRFRL